MIINHNIAAMNAQRNLGSINNKVSSNMEKLSSGFRINKAGDDAAGLAISEKMRGQINGLHQASRNAQDGISMIQTAEGGLSESHAILQRMRTLAVQAGTDTNTDADRVEMQKEVVQLKSELDRISENTEFNTKKLLNGDMANTATLDATNAAGLEGATITNDSLEAGDYTVTTTAVTFATDNTRSLSTGITDVALTTAADDLELGSYTISVVANETTPANMDISLLDANGEVLAQSLDNASGVTDITLNTADSGVITITRDATLVAGETTFDIDASTTFSVTDADGTEIGAATITDSTDGTVSVGGFDIEIDTQLTAVGGASTLTVATNAVDFQIGANEGQTTSLSVSDMSASALSLTAVDLSTQAGASSAITTINDAISTVSSERSKLGAVQNRLDYTISNLNSTEENTQAAESRIRDLDMANEMVAFTKNNIISQAATSMLAQANQATQSVLTLLR
ncbi:MAG: flagellin [Vallitaleaceae bacterium]|jgi:flagellin|nr:flagellin [Vallitaleaceae bacterium]